MFSKGSSRNPSATEVKKLIPLSKLDGTKKALIIGISYKQKGENRLANVKSAKLMKSFVLDHHGFPEENIVLLIDETDEALVRCENITNEMKNLVKDAKAHDSLFFFFAGHGIQRPDQIGDEHNNLDEGIGTGDKCMADDFIYQTLIKDLPQECRLTGVIHACHAGTLFDLPYEYNEHGKTGRYDPSQACEAITRSGYFNYLYSTRAPAKKFAPYNPDINEAKKDPPKDVVLFSSCADKELSNSNIENGVSCYNLFMLGFLECANPYKNPTYLSIIKGTAEFLRNLRITT